MVFTKNVKFSLSLFFLKMGLDKLYDYVRHENKGFVDYKKMTLEQNPKIVIFFKGVKPWFWTKFEIPSQFVDIPLDYVLQRKQGFLDSKNNIRAKSKDFHFSKGVDQQEPITRVMGSC